MPFSNDILLMFVLGAYSLFIIMLSGKLLLQYRVRFKLFAGALLLVWAVLNFKDLVVYLTLSAQSQLDWITMTDQLIVPCVGITLCELYRPHSVTAQKVIIHCLPFAAMLFVYCAYPEASVISWTVLMSAVYSVMIVGKAFRSLSFHILSERKAILRITGSFIGVVTIWVGSVVWPGVVFEIVYFVVTGLLWCYIYYNIEVAYLPRTELEHPLAESVEDKVSKHPFSESLFKLFEQEKIFLNPDLGLNDVARLIGTNRSYLSEYFNRARGITFNDYVNNLRLLYAENLICVDFKTSIEEIALTSGFNSVSTFRRAFHKKHGMSPSQYRQSRRESRPDFELLRGDF